LSQHKNPQEKKQRSPRLASVAALLAEARSCYRDARAGRMRWQDCNSAIRCLSRIREMMESTELMQRMTALEVDFRQVLEQERRPIRTNGHDCEEIRK
jgi:hypothetical protein